MINKCQLRLNVFTEKRQLEHRQKSFEELASGNSSALKLVFTIE